MALMGEVYGFLGPLQRCWNYCHTSTRTQFGMEPKENTMKLIILGVIGIVVTVAFVYTRRILAGVPPDFKHQLPEGAHLPKPGQSQFMIPSEPEEPPPRGKAHMHLNGENVVLFVRPQKRA